ncbi:MAG: PAAR domain-containing protein [Candidatus Methanosuratincola sp.]
MGSPAAKLGDLITATDVHMVLMPSPGGPVPTFVNLPFIGSIVEQVSKDVFIESLPAATVGSVAFNTPPHIAPPPGTFAKPPSNKAQIIDGSKSVFINGKPAARSGDPAVTCNDPVDLPVGTVTAIGKVLIG